MKNKVRLLLVQNSSVLNNSEENFKNIQNLLKPYKDIPADLIVFPEVWASGWDCKNFANIAEDSESSEIIKFLSEIAIEFSSNVIGGTYIKRNMDGSLTNTCPVFDRDGKLIAQYDKMHLFSHFGCKEDNFIKKGDKPVIADTDVASLGLSICYDLRFPELYRAYASKGADILVNVAAWPQVRKNHWLVLQKARALENQSFVIAVSQAGQIKGDSYNLGYSMIISPNGDILAQLYEEEGVLDFEINLEDMLSLRKSFPVLNDRAQNYDISEVE